MRIGNVLPESRQSAEPIRRVRWSVAAYTHNALTFRIARVQSTLISIHQCNQSGTIEHAQGISMLFLHPELFGTSQWMRAKGVGRHVQSEHHARTFAGFIDGAFSVDELQDPGPVAIDAPDRATDH